MQSQLATVYWYMIGGASERSVVNLWDELIGVPAEQEDQPQSKTLVVLCSHNLKALWRISSGSVQLGADLRHINVQAFQRLANTLHLCGAVRAHNLNDQTIVILTVLSNRAMALYAFQRLIDVVHLLSRAALHKRSPTKVAITRLWSRVSRQSAMLS